jgi:hypothetical protein
MGHHPRVIDEFIHRDVHVLDEAPIAVVVDAVRVLGPDHLRNEFDERLKERLDCAVRRCTVGLARHRHIFNRGNPCAFLFERTERDSGRRAFANSVVRALPSPPEIGRKGNPEAEQARHRQPSRPRKSHQKRGRNTDDICSYYH